MWIGANRALLHMQDGQFTSRGRELDSQQVYDIARTRDGDLYVAARFGVYRCVDDGPFDEVSSNQSAFCVMEDRDGGLWIGHGDNRGLHCYRNSYAQAIWNEAPVRCVSRDSVGNLWFGSNNGLHRLQDGVITDYGLDDGLPDPKVQTIAMGSGNTLWIGTAKGFAQWSGSAVVSGVTPGVPADLNIGVVFEDSYGTLWFSLATAGAFTLRDGVLTELQAFSLGRVHWFWEDSRGDVWIGHESGLFRRRDGQIRKVTDPAFGRLYSPRFLCHFASEDGTLWMGTSNGIVRRQSDRFDAFAPDCGLRADNIGRIVADHDGNLWFGGRDGLFHASLEELEAVATGRLKQVTSFRVEGFDRFPPLRAFSQGCLVRNDHLWIVAEQGLTRMPIEPLLRTPPPPTVHIEHATVDGVAATFERRFEYLAGRRRLSIQFAAPAFVNPKHVQIKYRLHGRDDDWVDAGGDRVVHYTDLRPGEYRFRVSARNGNGDWSEAVPSMDFTVRPRWWETMWFRAMVVFGLIGLALFSIKQYTRGVRKRNVVLRREIHERKQAEERARDYFQQLARTNRAASMGEMATSIAHEVNQPLFAVVSNAQTAKRLLDQDQPDIAEVRDALDDIVDDGNRASSTIARVRSRVRKEPHPTERIDLNAVALDVVRFAEPEIRRRGLTIQTDLASDLPPVLGNAIEIQQVILNLMINGAQAMRDTMADSRILLLETRADDDGVELAVVDRGVGLDEEFASRMFEPFFTTKPQGTGMGLAINRTIIEAHGGRIWATPNDDRGATFHFRLPAQTETKR